MLWRRVRWLCLTVSGPPECAKRSCAGAGDMVGSSWNMKSLLAFLAPPDQSPRRVWWTWGGLWTAAVMLVVGLGSYFVWQDNLVLARNYARLAYEKDVLYRTWNTEHGPVYVPISTHTPPNPYLAHLPHRDVTTLDGQQLTMVNPAYMTRLVHELQRVRLGYRGHITSLKAIRPENKPDAWEALALQMLQTGQTEVAEVVRLDGVRHLRFMGPLVTTASCLECHALQGYHEGDIRGGISVSVPVDSFWSVAGDRHGLTTAIGLLVLWIVGLLGIHLGAQQRQRRIEEIHRVAAEREQMIRQLEDALGQVKTLSGLLPICAWCKKIRDQRGSWDQIESYVTKHSEAKFSHGLCPDCAKQHFGMEGEESA